MAGDKWPLYHHPSSCSLSTLISITKLYHHGVYFRTEAEYRVPVLGGKELCLPVAEGDSALGQIVRRQLESDLVAREHADAVPSQPAGQMGQNHAVVLELDAEQSTGKFL